MKKLVLSLESLRVESFTPEETVEERGTVEGHSPLTELKTCLFTCEASCETWVCLC